MTDTALSVLPLGAVLAVLSCAVKEDVPLRPRRGSRRSERGIDLWRFREGKIGLKDAYRKVDA